jgi:hypothetical protein
MFKLYAERNFAIVEQVFSYLGDLLERKQELEANGFNCIYEYRREDTNVEPSTQ